MVLGLGAYRVPQVKGYFRCTSTLIAGDFFMARSQFPVRREQREHTTPQYDLMSFGPFGRPLSRLFDEMFSSLRTPAGLSSFSDMGMEFMPRTNIVENERELRISVELPGLEEEDVDVTLTRDGVRISGERHEEMEGGKGTSRHYIESSYGRFERFIPLTAEVDEENVEAHFDRGVLQIVLPKTEEARSREHKIKVTSTTTGNNRKQERSTGGERQSKDGH